jgi:hypothetical protein
MPVTLPDVSILGEKNFFTSARQIDDKIDTEVAHVLGKSRTC